MTNAPIERPRRVLAPLFAVYLVACGRGERPVSAGAEEIAEPVSAALEFRPNVVRDALERVSQACSPPCAARVEPLRNVPGITVAANCEFDRTSDQQFLVVTASMAPAGTLIDWEERGDPGTTDPVTHERRRDKAAFGPGGSFRSIDLVTGDGCLDIVVGVAEQLPNGVDIECDLNGLARSLADALAPSAGSSECARFFNTYSEPGNGD